MSFALAWSPELATGHSTIDTQHKELFAAANALFAACQTGKEMQAQEVERTMEFLLKYAIKHFADEEALQKKYDYPEYLAHKGLHEDFTGVAHALLQKFFQDGPTDDFISEVYIVIGEWLLNHVRGEDLKMVAYIQSKAQPV